MVFSSTIFLLCFLPIMLLLYYIAKREYRNGILLAGSLLFYAWGEPKYIILMLFSIILNYVFALLVVRQKEKNIFLCKIYLAIDIVANFLLLFYFKYWDFVIENVNYILGKSLPEKGLSLPIGISFFTFQAVSYVIDCYRGEGKVQKNPVNVALYIALFPQLIAGPIVRYQTISDQIKSRQENIPLFVSGIQRFLLGMAKKSLIANSFAYIADTAFGSLNRLSVVSAWIGAIAYSLQIYFDFSGYSDMAIGLGKMFGFRFLENFDYPYISKSITEFWRRWHISLGTWFRDYVYIPLGGNRKGIYRQYLNLAIVWLCTGIWHGANWTYIVWGIYYGILIMLEKGKILKWLDKSKVIGHLYTMFLVILAWVFFRADSLTQSYQYLQKMFGVDTVLFHMDAAVYQLIENRFFILIGFITAAPVFPYFVDKLDMKQEKWWKIGIAFCFYIMIGILVVTSILSSSYNPFIYFNF